MSLRWKIILFTVIPIVCIYMTLMFYNALKMREWTIVNVESRMSELAQQYANGFDGRLQEAEQIAKMTAAYIENNPNLTSEQFYAQLETNLKLNPLVYGSAICFEPYQFQSDRRFYVRYVYRSGNTIQRADPSTSGYDYTEAKQEYWHRPRNTGQPAWTEPYFDEGAGDVIMCTYSVPFFRNNAFWGIATVDIPLESLRELVDLGISKDFDIRVVTTGGNVVYSPEVAHINRSIHEIADTSENEETKDLVRKCLTGETGVKKLTGWIDEEREWVFYRPIKSSGWGFAISIPEHAALDAVQTQFYRNLGFMISTLFLIVTSLWFVTNMVTRPLVRLQKAVAEIGSGNLEVRIKNDNKDEIGWLARSFNEMAIRISQREYDLQVSEKRFRALFEQAAVGVAQIDTQTGRFHRINQKYCDIVGLTKEEMMTTTFMAITYPDDLQFDLDNMQKLIAGEIRDYSMEKRYYHKNRSIVWVNLTVSPMWGAGEQPNFHIAVVVDITKRKNAEKALIESEERYRTLTEDSPIGIWQCDIGGKTIYVNPTMCAMLEVSDPDELSDLQWESFYTPESLKIISSEQEKRFKGQSSFYEVKLKGKKGREYNVIIHGFPLFDENGTLIGTIGSFLDITDRKRVEEELRESEERFRRLAENAKDMIYRMSLPDGHYEYVSPAVYDIFGISPQDLYNSPFLIQEIIHPDWKEYLSEEWKALLTGKMPPTYEYQIIHKSGDIRWLNQRNVLIKSDDGQPIAMEGIVTDITEQKQAEEESVLLERQVQQAQKLESLGVLAGGIAHDFNNLLMVILGNADLALQFLSPHAPARDNIKNIETAARRAAALSKQMLAYSGKGQFVIELIHLNEFIKEMTHLIEVSISKKAILKFNYSDRLPLFEGDATQIRQVIMNLITNASEAIGDRSGVIALSTGVMECDRAYLETANFALRAGLERQLAEGIYVYIEVADTGCGMDAETQEKVFDPFFTTKFMGRGLGMAAVLGIVRGHNGAIKIYSEPNKGTTFKVLFPVKENSFMKDLLVKDNHGNQDQNWSGRGTVLIADDEESVLTVGKQMLEFLGFTVIPAPNGREAVDIFRKHSAEISLVILDLTMPHLNGEEAFREIRRVRSEVKVILSSGYNEQDATQQFAGKGLAGFLQKPFTLAKLREKLQTVFNAS